MISKVPKSKWLFKYRMLLLKKPLDIFFGSSLPRQRRPFMTNEGMPDLPDLSGKRPFEVEVGTGRPIDGYREGKKSIIIGNKPPAPLHPTPPSTRPSDTLVAGETVLTAQQIKQVKSSSRADIENEVLALLLKFKNHRITFDDAVQQLTDRIYKSDNA